MANKPLDKGYLLTQFKNFFDEKIKGTFVPSENLTSTTTVVAKDLDVTVTDGSVDLAGPRVTANGSDILTENLFPHNLLARYVGITITQTGYTEIFCGLDKSKYSGAKYLVPYVYGSFSSAPSSGYTTVYPTVLGFNAPYTGTFYLGMFKNDGNSRYIAARRYIDVVLEDVKNNTSVVVMSRNSDYDKFGVDISLIQGHSYRVALRVYYGFNIPIYDKFYVYPSLYTHTVDNFDYKTFYSILLCDRGSWSSGGYRGINQLTDLYDMITTLSNRIENVASQSRKTIYISSYDFTTSELSEDENMYVVREDSWVRFRAKVENINCLVSIKSFDYPDECQITFLFTATAWGIRFRLLDYYGGSSSRIVAYDSDGDKTWYSLSSQQTGWELKISDEGQVYDDFGFKLQLYGINGREITKFNGTDPIQVSITLI